MTAKARLARLEKGSNSEAIPEGGGEESVSAAAGPDSGDGPGAIEGQEGIVGIGREESNASPSPTHGGVAEAVAATEARMRKQAESDMAALRASLESEYGTW